MSKEASLSALRAPFFGPQIFFFPNTAMKRERERERERNFAVIAKGTFTISGGKNSSIQHRFREEKTVKLKNCLIQKYII
jgi:hypothetical protein